MADRRRRALTIAAAGAVLVAATTAVSATIPVRAHLSYAKRGVEYRSLTLEITRGDRTWRSGRLGTTYFNAPTLTVRDLDADAEPEVWFDTYSGGAHCCRATRFFRYRQVSKTYGDTTHSWGNAGYRLANVDRRERPELVSRDDRFAYAFTSFALSYFPVRIWHFDRGRLVDVTRRFPTQVAGDAADLWRSYVNLRRERMDVRGALAAWLADQYQLGRAEVGWAKLEGAYRRGELDADSTWPAGRAYLVALKAHLERLGYAEPRARRG